MKTAKKGDKKIEQKHSCNHNKRVTSNNAVYGLGFIGAAIFYISTATSFWMGVLGLLKAIVWPAFVIYETLKVLY